MNPETQAVPSNPQQGLGYLIVRVSTARGAIPLEGAEVNIRSELPEITPGRGDVIASLVSGRDGRTEPVALPAPAREESMHPGNAKPYATYGIEVFLEGYTRQIYQNVPIFDGIVAIQPAILIPLPENGRTDSRTPDGERINESFVPKL